MLYYRAARSKLDRAGIEHASSGVDAYIERTRWDIEQERSCNERTLIEHAPQRIQSARPVFCQLKKSAPQECRSLNSFVRLSVKIIREHKLIEGVLKAKPQTRHRAWLMCNERTLIEHASSEQKKQIERRPVIERRPSGNRAETERKSSGDRAPMVSASSGSIIEPFERLDM